MDMSDKTEDYFSVNINELKWFGKAFWLMILANWRLMYSDEHQANISKISLKLKLAVSSISDGHNQNILSISGK